jgi:hypothetical protein
MATTQDGPPEAPPQRPYTDAFLRPYSEEHVFYEFDMLFWATRTLDPRTGTRIAATTAEGQRRLNSALVEAFPVHLRNVIEFLFRGTPKATPERSDATYRGSPRDTDVGAADFCRDRIWTPPAISQALVTAHERADREIGHLTSMRLPPGDERKKWDAVGLLEKLLPTMLLFVDSADPVRLAPNVVALVGAQGRDLRPPRENETRS